MSTNCVMRIPVGTNSPRDMSAHVTSWRKETVSYICNVNDFIELLPTIHAGPTRGGGSQGSSPGAQVSKRS